MFLRDGSADTVERATTLRYIVQIKLVISPSLSIQTLGQLVQRGLYNTRRQAGSHWYDSPGRSINNNVNNHTQRRFSSLFSLLFNLITVPRTISNTRGPVARAQSCANYVQITISGVYHMPHGACLVVRRDSSTDMFNTAEIVFS